MDIPGGIISRAVRFWRVIQPLGSSAVWAWWVTGYSMSGNRITFTTSESNKGWVRFSAFEIPQSPAVGTYGLLLQDSANFMAITESSELGFARGAVM